VASRATIGVMDEKNTAQRLQDFFEHPLVWGPLGIIGGLVGLFFYPPVLIICGFCILLAFHRAKVVVGKSRKTQVCAYILLFTLTLAALYGIERLIKTHAPDLAHDIAKEVIKDLQPNRSPQKQQEPTPGQTQTQGSSKRAVLKPPIERTVKFAVMIPFDTAPNAFPIPHDENPDDPMFRTYGDLASLATKETMPPSARDAVNKGERTSWNSVPVSTEDAPAFFGKLLRYYILTSIDNLQRNSVTVAIGYPAEARAGIEPPNVVPYPNKKLFRELAKSSFYWPFEWEHKPPIRMPKGTEIRFAEEEKPAAYLVRLERPGYFKIEYKVTQSMGTGVGSVPKNFATSRASTTMQWAFFVTMHYTIYDSDDNDFNPSLYAQWADALYDGLHKRLTVD
jgi:hypothetical protein